MEEKDKSKEFLIVTKDLYEVYQSEEKQTLTRLFFPFYFFL